MEVAKILKTKEGRIKVYRADGVSHTFWHEGEFREFAERNLRFKPDDVPLQEAVKSVLKITPTLDEKSLSAVKGTLSEIKSLVEAK